MKALLLFILILVLIGGGMKLAGMQLPVLDYRVGPLGPPKVNLIPGGLRGGDSGGQMVIPLH